MRKKVKYLMLLTTLVTTTALIAVENKIPSVSNLVKRLNITNEIENKISNFLTHSALWC